MNDPRRASAPSASSRPAATRTDRRFAWGVAIAMALVAPSSRAQTASELATAKRWFSEGLALEEQQKWGEALADFKRVLAVKRTPQVAFHLGLCEARVGQLVEAMVDLERSIELARSQSTPDVEKAAQAELDELRPRVPQVRIDAPSTATRIVLDGAAIATETIGAKLPVNPGDHTIVVEFPSGSVTKTITARERESLQVAIDPPAAAEATKRPAPVVIPEATSGADRGEPPPRVSGRSSTMAYVTLGAGVALAAVGGVFWKLRGDEVTTLDGMCPGRVCPRALEPDVNTHRSSGERDAALAVAGFALGGAAIATGVVLLVRGGGAEPPASAGDVRFTATVVPSPRASSPGGALIGASGHF